MQLISKGKTNWKILLIVVVIAATVDGGIWYYQYEEKSNTPELFYCEMDKEYKTGECKCPNGTLAHPTSRDLQMCKPVSRGIVDETADWQTYKNEEYGFGFRYPTDIFTEVVVEKSLPPGYEEIYDGIKLIFSERVVSLGKTECSYGQSGLISVCQAEKEGGIEFIPISKSLQKITSSLNKSLKKEEIIAGKKGISYSIGAEGEGTDYYFIPIEEDQTLVVARFYRVNFNPNIELFNQILSTLIFLD